MQTTNTKTNRTRTMAMLLATALTTMLIALISVAQPAQAAFPGKSGNIALERSGDIWTMNPDGTGAKNLTNSFNGEGNPAVSPNGSKIAYEYLSGIWVMNGDGSGKKMLTDGAQTDGAPAWSADGTKIAFIRNNKDIWVMSALDGSGQKNLTNTPSIEEYDVAWSPKGDKIAYTNFCVNDTCLGVMNADGTGKKNLAANDSEEPAWSPDGTKIAYNGPPGGTIGEDIWVMKADGTEKKNLIRDSGTGDAKPAFSPDGTKIVFQTDRGDTSGIPDELYVMSAADGSGMKRLTTNTDWDENPDWQPLPPFDITAPTVSTTMPANFATGVASSANVTATFSEAMQASTLNTTVKLVKKGTTTTVAATVTYDAATKRVTLNPAADLQSGVTYTATVTTGAKDLAGIALDQNPAVSGNQGKTWSFTVR